MGTRAYICKVEPNNTLAATYIHYGDYKEIIEFLKRVDTPDKINWLIDRGEIISTQDNTFPMVTTIKDSYGDLWVNRFETAKTPLLFESFDEFMHYLKVNESFDIEYIYVLESGKITVYGKDKTTKEIKFDIIN